MKNHKQYLKSHGFNKQFLIDHIMKGDSLALIAAIALQFAYQDEHETKVAEQAKLAEQDIINKIQNVDFNKQPLTLVFNKNTIKFNKVQQVIYNKVHQYEHISKLYVDYTYYNANGVKITKTKSLANKEGIEFVNSLLTEYYLKEDININKDQFQPIYSDSAEMGASCGLTINMIKQLKIYNKDILMNDFDSNEGPRNFANSY